MASLSVEEENYVRMGLLLTGISPRAVRTFFDSEFAPACLDATLKKEYNKLLDLKKKHIINQSQWNLLFPRFPDVPDSKTFDVTLVILLLRNLTLLTPPLCGFDILPSAMEITQAADLARIKHYRNYLAHLDEGKLDIGFFNTAWNDITCAIARLGGQQIKQECDLLKTRTLDQTNQEIMTDIKHSNDEISKLKESFRSLKRSHSDMLKSHELLQEYHRRVKKSHELLQEEHAKMTKKMKIIKISKEDTVPWNIRARINDTLKDWKDNDDMMFISTRAAEYVLKCIQENSCVTITASSGVGKTATLRHVALQMAEEGYDVQMVTDPADIVRFCNPNKKTLFVVDDLCGNFSLDQSDIKCWEPIMEDINQHLDKTQTKILAACRLQVYQDEKFKSLSVFKTCVCNLLSENICLTKTEKQSLSELYLKTKASEIADFHDLYDGFPLLCKLYHNNPKLDITNFFQNPFSVYEAEIDMLFRKGHYTKYCALALCVMFNNNVKEDMLTKEVDEETNTIIENICQECELDKGISRLVLQDELESLKDTFIRKEGSVYKAIHARIFDFLAFYFGHNIVLCLIRHADSALIKNRFLLEENDDMDQFITVLPAKYHQMYIERMIDDWSKGKVQDVFSNINMKIPQFTQKFLCYLNKLDISYQRQLAHTCDVYNKDTALLQCCLMGDIPLIQWCISQGVDINQGRFDGLIPLFAAKGHSGVVRLLLDNKAAIFKCRDNWSKDERIPEEIRNMEQQSIDIYKRALQSGSEKKRDINLVIVGKKGAGKTSLVRRLFGEEFTKFESTNGIEIHRRQCKIKSNEWTRIGAKRSEPPDVLCDGIHLVCFTDKRLHTRCVDNEKNLIKEESVLHDLFYQTDENSKLSKLKPEYQIIKSLIESQNKIFAFEKEVLDLAVINKMAMLCRWLLANFSYDDDFLTPVLSKSYEIGYNDVIKALSWKVTREFYKRFKRNLKDKVVDIYPAYQCQCHSLTQGQQCLPVSKKLIVIESIAENTISIPNTFCNFEISNFEYSEIKESSNMPQTEMEDVLKKMSDLLSPNSYSLFLPEINGHVASSLFRKHRNLSLICPSTMKSSGYGKKHSIVSASVCLQLFCHRKGIIPLGESHFPKDIRGIQTDVLQGRGHFASTTLRVGDKIGTTTSCGTLGGFYQYCGRYECFLTCAHVVLSLSNLIAPCDDMCHNRGVDVIFNPPQGHQMCGKLIRKKFKHGNPNRTSIDAALIDIESPLFTINPNDIVQDSSGVGKPFHCLGLVSPFVNHNYCDHTFLCCTRSKVSTVALGSVSKIGQDVTFENTRAEDVYLNNLGNVAANVNGAHYQPLVNASPAHMQIPVGAVNDRRVFTMYNQMAMNIPLREGDSGTCIYITGNTQKNTGCVGMANSFCSGSGLSLVTPIDEIIKAMN